MESLFAILFEVLLIQIQEEIHHFAGRGGGGVKGHKNCELKFCEQTGVSYFNTRRRGQRSPNKQWVPKAVRELAWEAAMFQSDSGFSPKVGAVFQKSESQP